MQCHRQCWVLVILNLLKVYEGRLSLLLLYRSEVKPSVMCGNVKPGVCLTPDLMAVRLTNTTLLEDKWCDGVAEGLPLRLSW